jgi:hypothetical protein
MLVVPFVSMGEIRLGASEAEVREKIGLPQRRIERGRSTQDIYPDIGMHIFYGQTNSVNYLEGFAPAVLIFESLVLNQRPFVEVKNELHIAGYDARYDDGGWFYDSPGFNLWLDTADEGEENVESVAIYLPGYYAT